MAQGGISYGKIAPRREYFRGMMLTSIEIGFSLPGYSSKGQVVKVGLPIFIYGDLQRDKE
jgi:hypothetical protein